MSEPIPWTSTKKEIYHAYKDVLKKYEHSIANPPPPQQVQRETERKEALQQKVAQHTPDSLIEAISRMKQSIGKTLDVLADELGQEARKLTEIRAVSEIARADFERMTDGKVAAEGIEAWLSDHEKERRELMAAMQDEKKAFDVDQSEARQAWEREKSEWAALMKEQDELTQKERLRAEQEYKYQQQLQRRKDADERAQQLAEFERDLAQRRKSAEDEMAAIRHELTHSKDEFDRLKSEALEWPERLQAAKASARKEATLELTRDFEHRIASLQQKAESAKEISSIRIQTLENYIAKQDERIEELSRKLEQETSRVHEIANKAVEGASGVSAFSAVNRIALEQAKRGATGKNEEHRGG